VNAVSAVVTTGIYCRPGCSARPRSENVRAFPLAAAAEAAGYRPCHRCRPYRSPQPLSWEAPELVCQAVRLILDGVLDRGTEAELAARLGVSARHLRRLFSSHLGVTPDGLARSARAHFARRLLDDTDLTITEIAFAAGFGSIRQFNRACREIFRESPRALRARRRKADRLVADGGLLLRLPFHGPLDWGALLAEFRARAVPGVEHVSGGVYGRTIVVDGNPGVLELLPGDEGELLLRAHLPHWEGLVHVVQRARRIAGLDSKPREAGTWDPFQTGVQAIVGRTDILARLVELHGTAVPGLAELGLTHTFPSPAALADADLGALGFTSREAETIRSFARAVADDEVRLDGSVGLDGLIATLTAIEGLDPWTAHSIARRLGEPVGADESSRSQVS
jgi:AraC family transcriptional regulator, regulatory protein of adaptative response / DNA-3-methyladenine glycosylase II